jgi:hypothetical protein
MPSATGPLARLKRDATRIKEELLEQEAVAEDLGNGRFVSATLDELLAREPVKGFGNRQRTVGEVHAGARPLSRLAS